MACCCNRNLALENSKPIQLWFLFLFRRNSAMISRLLAEIDNGWWDWLLLGLWNNDGSPSPSPTLFHHLHSHLMAACYLSCKPRPHAVQSLPGNRVAHATALLWLKNAKCKIFINYLYDVLNVIKKQIALHKWTVNREMNLMSLIMMWLDTKLLQ